MDRQYVRQSSASASRAFCSSLVTLAAERIKLQRVVTNSCAPPASAWPFFPFTNEHCDLPLAIQAENAKYKALRVFYSFTFSDLLFLTGNKNRSSQIFLDQMQRHVTQQTPVI